MAPLNPQLYAALKRKFRHVRIENQCEKMRAIYKPDMTGKPRLEIVLAGEEYIVACPYCHDTSGHLYFNHRWGMRDPVNGTRNLWLAHCFLEGCLRENWERKKELAEQLLDCTFPPSASTVDIVEVTESLVRLEPVELPEDFQLLTALSSAQTAWIYMRERGFDVHELSQVWGVGFSSIEYREYPGRLVIPLRACLREFDDPRELIDDPDAWQVVGYQGRYLGDPPPKVPKYLTKGAKSQLLYGLDRVPLDDTTPITICEGVTDVWRAGPGAVALLGKSISRAQSRLLRKIVPGRDIVVLLDPEASSEAEKVASEVQAVLNHDLSSQVRPGRVVVGQLPDARDPGDCSRDEIKKAVRKALSLRRRPRRKSSGTVARRDEN